MCKKLVLASASPRRKDLLKSLGIDIDIRVSRVDETPFDDENPLDYGARMAGEKCRAVMSLYPRDWVLAADTVVSVGRTILGKPASRKEAVETLMLLGGRDHLVATSFALGNSREERFQEETVRTRVYFAAISEHQASAYAQTGEPDDKAGAYGIQGLGGVFVREIWGSYSNVVGLPMCQVLAALSKYGIVKTK